MNALKSSSLFILVYSFIVFSNQTIKADEAHASTLTIDQIADGVSNYYRRIDSLRGFHIEYDMSVQNFVDQQYACFGWNNVKGVYKLKGPKSYYRVMGDAYYKDTRPLDSTFTWNGEIGMCDENTYLFSISKSIQTRHAAYSFLLCALYYERETDIYNEANSISYRTNAEELALPISLASFQKKYKVDPSKDLIDGVWCHVVDRPGYDKIWVDCEDGFCIKKREYKFRPSGSIREIVYYSKHQPIKENLIFPRRIVQDLFTPPGKAHNSGKVCSRLNFNVSVAEEMEIDDDLFSSMKPKPGATVYDERTQTRYIFQKNDHTTLYRAIADAKLAMKQNTPWGVFIKTSVAVMLVLSMLLGVRKLLRKSS